jgi:hypothetical protein
MQRPVAQTESPHADPSAGRAAPKGRFSRRIQREI